MLALVWWKNSLVEILGVVLIVLLNTFLIWPLFSGLDRGTHFSGPLLPVIGQTTAFVSGISLAAAFQITYLFFFLLFPVSFCALVYFLTRRRLTTLFAVLIAALPEYVFAESRIASGFFYGDGPHIASLAIVPLAVIGLILFLRRGGKTNLVATALLGALVMLTSPIGFGTYVIFAIVAGFSEMLLGFGRLKLARFLVAFILSAAMVSFWYNPAFVFWLIFGPMGKEIRMVVWNLVPMSFFILPVLGTFGYLLFSRKPGLQPAFLGFFWTAVFLIIILVAKGNGTAFSSRYLSELGIALSLLVGLLLTALVDGLKSSRITLVPALNKPSFSNPIIALLLVVLFIAVVLPRQRLFGDIRAMEKESGGFSKGRYWLEKESFGGLHSILGYVITGGTVGSLVFLKMKRSGNS